MIPIDFPQRNFVYEKPPSMTDEECHDLEVCKTTDSAGYPLIVSCWKPNKEELEQINRTGVVWLGVIGENQPPVWLSGENPFIK